MAYFGKLGGLVRQTVARSMLQQHGGALAVPAMYLTQRGMAGSKLFVGGLAWELDDATLKEAFSNFGEVIEVKIICDRDTGRSRGFGFVEFTTDEEANAALGAMDGRELAGHSIRVDYAVRRSPQERGSYGGFGGRSSGGGDESSGFGGSGGWRGM